MILKVEVGGVPIEIDIRKVMNTEAIEVEKVTGLGYRDFLSKLDDGDVGAITALVWIARKRTEPELRYRDVQFPIADWNNREWLGLEDEVDDEADESGPTPAAADEPAIGSA